MSLNTATTASNRLALESPFPASPLPETCRQGRAVASADWAAQALSAAVAARAEVCRNDCLEEEPERWDGLS
jgi:hypothetical protein